MALDNDTPTTVIEPANGADIPEIPESRVRDGWQAHAIFRRLEYDDWEADQKRGLIDYQIDGGLPYSPRVLADAGRGEDANVNFMEAKSEDDLAQTPFIEMTTVASILWRITTKFGDAKENKLWSQIISEKFTEMVRAWGAFNYFRQRLAQQFTRHGAGFAYFEDDINWKWRADGLSAFKLPKNTESYADAIDYCTCKRSLTVTQLYNPIRDEEAAREIGRWNVDAVKIALRTASKGANRDIYNYNWEEFLKDAKENNTALDGRAEEVLVYHLWCLEYDGTIAHYIGLQNGVALSRAEQTGSKPFAENKKEGTEKAPEDMVGNGFLYAHRQRFPSFESAIIPFYYAIGTHATVHSIRGQGDMNYTPIAIANRARCTLLDLAKASGMTMLQCETANDAETFAYTQVGPFLLMPANAKVQANALPDISQRMQPVLGEMAALRAQLSPSSTSQPAPPQNKTSKQPETKYSIQSKQHRGGALNSAILTMFFEPWERLGKEMYRRVSNPALREDDPGGKEAFAFRVACMSEDVPAEALLFENCKIEAVRVIGNGSPEARQFTAEQIKEFSSQLDPEGQYEANFQYLTSLPGVDANTAELLLGPGEPRKPFDAQIADLENSLFSQGIQAKVTGEQNHWVHCQEHMELVKSTDDAFNQQQVDGPGLVKVLAPALDNMLGHSEYLTKDKTKEKESATVRKFIQNFSGVLQQQQTKMLAEQRRQTEQQQGGQQPSLDDAHKQQLHALKMQSAQMELENKQREFNMKLAIQQQEAHLRQTLADTKAAIDLAERNSELASTQF
jgi:hypothetical protein